MPLRSISNRARRWWRRSRATNRWGRRWTACSRWSRRAAACWPLTTTSAGSIRGSSSPRLSTGRYLVRALRLSLDAQQHDRVCRQRSVRLSADADHKNVCRLSLAAGGHARPRDAARAVWLEHSRGRQSRRRYWRDGASAETRPGGQLATPVAVENHATRCETEPNDSPDGEPIELPVTVSGRIEKARDVDVFRFDARKGQSLTFQVESRALGFPLDAVLAITDAAGKQLARVDDVAATRDATLTFSPPPTDRIAWSCPISTGREVCGTSIGCAPRRPSPTSKSRPMPMPMCYRRPSRSRSRWPCARQNGFDEEIGFSVSGLPASVAACCRCVGRPGGYGQERQTQADRDGWAVFGTDSHLGTSNGNEQASCTRPVPPLPVGGRRTTDLWLSVVAEKP